MALEENGGTPFTMPVMPAYGGGYGGNGSGFFGGDWAWIILLLLIGGNGWGFGGGFGGGMWPMMMGGMNGFGLDYLYPWLNNSQHISDGFRDQQLQSTINGLQNSVTSGFGDVQLGIAGINQNICQTGNGIVSAINSGFNSAEVAANTRQIANMQQAFAAQTATAQGFTGVNSGIADLRYTVATEACADRAAVGDALQAVTMQGVQNTNALMTTLNNGIQSIKDQLCQDKIDAKNDEISQLRQEVLFARGQASQIAQNQQIVDGIYNRLDTCPVGTTPVYGRTPIFTCNGGCNGGFAA